MKSLANHPNPPQLFHEGDLADTLVKDIQHFGGIITKEDFANYKFVFDSLNILFYCN